MDKLATMVRNAVYRIRNAFLGTVFGRLAFIWSSFQGPGRVRPLNVVNTILVLGVLLMTTLMAIEYFTPSPNASAFSKEAEKAYAVSPLSSVSTPQYGRFASEFSRRQLFRPPSAGATSRPSSGTDSEADENMLRVKKLILIGIITGPDPVAIVQHPESEQPIHYKTGDAIIGDFRVTEIARDGVTISNGTQTHNLKL